MSSKGKLSRRKLLLGTGVLATSTIAAGLWRIQPRRRRVAVADPSASPRFNEPFHVAVVGGGLAGLSAALELSERGAQVTLLEAAPHLGGKLGGWSVAALNERFSMEHGFHGFFSQYYNLNDTLRRLNATPNLRPTTAYPILFADRPEERFSASSHFFPLNMLALYARSPSLHWRSILSSGPRMQALLAYDPIKTYAAFDGVSFAELSASLDPGLYKAMLLPFAKTTLNRPERLSAAHALMFMHFYFLGNPEGLGYRVTDGDCMTTVVAPWADRLRNNGATVRVQAQVTALEVNGDKVSAVRLAQDSERAVGSIPTSLSEACEIGRDGDMPIFAFRENGRAVAVRGACTHMGCPVRLSSDGFACPCHGGLFDRAGVPTGGPPKLPLVRLPIRSDGVVFVPAAQGERIACDAVVLASDVRGTRRIVGASPLSEALKADVSALTEAEPYVVVRFWLDRRPAADRSEFYTVSGYTLLDSIALYDRLQGEYRSYCDRTGHGVVELHAYGVAPELDRGLEHNTRTLFAELQQAMPELRGSRVLHQEAMQQSNFSGFALGSHARRPHTTTPHSNLFLAGDWVRSDLPIALMEGAVTTGRLAANAILRSRGVAEVTIETVADHGVLA